MLSGACPTDVRVPQNADAMRTSLQHLDARDKLLQLSKDLAKKDVHDAACESDTPRVRDTLARFPASTRAELPKHSLSYR